MTNDKLAELLEGIAVNTEDYYRQDVLRTARDRLRDEWIPIKEFLEEPVEGLCWIYYGGPVWEATYIDKQFIEIWKGYAEVVHSKITHVIPINKPGLPK